MSETDPILELDALLDPARLAVAWQLAHARSPVAVADAASAGPVSDAVPEVEAPDPEAPDPEAPDPEAPDPEAPEVEAPEVEAPEVETPEIEAPDEEPARVAPLPLPVALAYRELLDEIERTWAASPAIAGRARRVLSATLAQLAAVIDPSDLPVDLAAAEAALDQLEDVLQALLAEAGWPESPERDED
jgi:hypothetical protein